MFINKHGIVSIYNLSEFEVGDRVKMSPEWADLCNSYLESRVVMDVELNRQGTVYKVGDEFDICGGIGVKWDDDTYNDVPPFNLINLKSKDIA
jgi:hypothetical protein